MNYTVAIVMDPITLVKPEKDTSFAMILEAQRRGLKVLYFELKDLFLQDGKPMGLAKDVVVEDRKEDFYNLSNERIVALSDIDVILMRKDPPFDTEYLYATQILTLAEIGGALVVNKPESLSNFNEKLFTSYFPDLIPSTLVSKDPGLIRAFQEKHGDIICKPLDGMGGASIFRIKPDGNNLGVIIETLTMLGRRYMMAQEYLPAIKDGDKRVIIVDGEVIPFCLARLPAKGETRGNLAAGGSGRPQPISETDRALAEKIAPVLKANGLLFVGLDVIGDKITEINITSPTCVREIEAQYDINILAKLFDAIERQLANANRGGQ